MLVCLLTLSSGSLAPAAQAAPVTRDAALEVINDLEARAVLTPEVAATQRTYYRTHPQQYPRSLWQKLRGVVTFANVIWAIASVLLILAIGWLVGLYFVALLMLIPAAVYEALAYGASIGLMVGSPDEFGALPGCLGLGASLAWSHVAHPNAVKPIYQTLRCDPLTLCALLLTLAWGAAAIWQDSKILGFIAVLALEATLGFAIAIFPGLYSIGFRSRAALPRAVLSSLGFIALYIPLHQGYLSLPAAELFQPGILFVGTFVYSLGLLIWSSRWYRHGQRWHYIALQLVTIASGVLMLYGGGVLGIQQFQAIGGTFFVLYLFEKYAEIPWQKAGFAWGLLGLAVLLGGLAWLMRQ